MTTDADLTAAVRALVAEEVARQLRALPQLPLPPTPRWLTTREAGEYASRHPDTILKACESGALEGRQHGKGGRWLIRPEWIDNWLEDGRD